MKFGLAENSRDSPTKPKSIQFLKLSPSPRKIRFTVQSTTPQPQPTNVDFISSNLVLKPIESKEFQDLQKDIKRNSLLIDQVDFLIKLEI
jgi:hypothetical protein